MQENQMNSLFEMARNVPDETSVKEVQKWIGYITIGTLLIGLLTQIKSIFTTKLLIMMSTISSFIVGTAIVATMSQSVENNKNVKLQSLQSNDLQENMIIQSLVDSTEVELANMQNSLVTSEVEDDKISMNLMMNFGDLKELNHEAILIVPTRCDTIQITDFGDFSGLVISTVANVIIIQGNENKVEIDGEDYQKELTSIRNVSGVLTIKSLTPDITFRVTVKNLNYVEISAASDLRSESVLEFEEFDLVASGSVNIELELKVNECHFQIGGATNLVVSGEVKKMTLDVDGASDIKAKDLIIESCDLDCSGAADVRLSVKENLNMDVSGASSFYLHGSPQIGTKTVNGAAKFRQF